MTERDALVCAHLHLVPLTVARVVPVVPLRIDVGDLESAGYLGLIKAADRFDPGRGTAFRSLAINWIRGSILQELRTEDWAPRSVRQQERRGEPVVVLEQISLEQNFYGRDPDEGEDNRKLSDLLVDPAPGPEEQALANDWAAGVRGQVEALEALTERERRLLWWYYEGDCTLVEISKRLGISASRIDQIKKRALADLRDSWQEQAKRKGGFY